MEKIEKGAAPEVVPATQELLKELGFRPEDLQKPGETLEAIGDQGVINAQVPEATVEGGVLRIDSTKKQPLLGVVPDSVRKTLKAAGAALVMAASGTAAGLGHMMLEKPQPAQAATVENSGPEAKVLYRKQISPEATVEQYIEHTVPAFEITLNGFNYDAGEMQGFVRNDILGKVYYAPTKAIHEGSAPRKPVAFRVDKANFEQRAEGQKVVDLSIAALDAIPVGERQYLGFTDKAWGGTMTFRGGTRPAGTSDQESNFQLGVRFGGEQLTDDHILVTEGNVRIINNATQEGTAGVAPSLGMGIVHDTGKFLAELGVVLDTKNAEALKGRGGLLAISGSQQFGDRLMLDAELLTTRGDEGKGSAQIIGRGELLDPKWTNAVKVDFGLGASVHGANVNVPELYKSQSEEVRIPVVVRVKTKFGTLELKGYVNDRGQLGAGIGLGVDISESVIKPIKGLLGIDKKTEEKK